MMDLYGCPICIMIRPLVLNFRDETAVRRRHASFTSLESRP